MGQVELERSERRLMVTAVRLANRRMRAEILPQVQPNAHANLTRSWNPLVVSEYASGFAMKLRMPDALVAKILQSNDLLQYVARIVAEALDEAILVNTRIEHTPFIAALIRDLFGETPRYDPATPHN